MEGVRDALTEVGINGMTVSEVKGFGRQIVTSTEARREPRLRDRWIHIRGGPLRSDQGAPLSAGALAQTILGLKLWRCSKTQ